MNRTFQLFCLICGKGKGGPGWSNKHAQRVAKKARNVKRARSGSR